MSDPDSAQRPIIGTELIRLDADLGADPTAVIGALAQALADDDRTTDADAVAAAALEREAKAPTGLPGGIAIPHCRVAAVTEPSLVFARLDPPVDFGAKDGPADIVFLIAAPEGAGAEHMKVLTALARALVRPEFVTALRDSATDEEALAHITKVIAPPPAPETPAADADTTPAAPTAAASAPTDAASASAAPARGKHAAPEPDTADGSANGPAGAPRTLIAVTACPTGIAHTYMAADSLVAAAKRAGVELVVETQGSSGATPIPPETIAAAGAVIFATDVGVKDRGRFAGKPLVASGVKRGIDEPDAMIAEALAAADDPQAARVAAHHDEEEHTGGADVGWGRRIQQVLMTGVSYMIPFVAAGGLLMALGFLVGGWEISDVADQIAVDNALGNLPDGGLRTYFGAVLFAIGNLAMGFLVPALSGYIAFGIADRPGIAPGFAAGAVSGLVGAGFLGGLVGGVIAGLVALWVGSWKVPDFVRGLMPVVIIPLIATVISGGIMILLLGKPLAAATDGMESFLNGLTGASAAALGALLGLMMCFDLGGPVNKAAYAFAVAGLSVTDVASQEIMAAVMLSGMVPPLAMALSSTLLRPRLYTQAERQNGKAAWLLGATFISEGAIPFAAADPLRVIPSMMAGGAVTGALAMMLGVTLKAPHGGLVVMFAVGNIAGFFIALVVGTVVAALLVTTAKTVIGKPQAAPAPVAA